MKRRIFLALPWVLACSRPRSRPLAEKPPLIGLAREFGEATLADEHFALAEIARIAARVAASDAPGDRIDRLIRLIFGELGFVREVESPALSCVLLPSVLRGRRGSCVGLGSLFLALAGPLELPLSGVMFPGHFFVRSSERGRERNLELLRGGESMPDAWYRSKYLTAGRDAPAYGRPLTETEVQGVIEYDIGNERRRGARLDEARSAFERAAQHFPDFAEAHASHGAVLQLLGRLDAAERAYRAARRADPALPGLDWNLELLNRERGNR